MSEILFGSIFSETNFLKLTAITKYIVFILRTRTFCVARVWAQVIRACQNSNSEPF
jgi:hypothetical protein